MPTEDPQLVAGYRHCVAVAGLLTDYTPDLGYTVQESSDSPQRRTEAYWERLRRLVRYL